VAEWLERQLNVQYSIDCGIESVCGKSFARVRLSRTFLSFFVTALTPPFSIHTPVSSVTAAQRNFHLADFARDGDPAIASGIRLSSGKVRLPQYHHSSPPQVSALPEP
jgi:hypothetical protein